MFDGIDPWSGDGDEPLRERRPPHQSVDGVFYVGIIVLSWSMLALAAWVRTS